MVENLSNLRHRLLCRIGRRYQVVTEQVDLGSICFPFSRIVNPDRVLDEVAAEADLRDRLAGKQAGGDELHLPYWAELWDSARGMGKYLINEECRVKNEECRNLEISKSASLFTLHSSFFTYDVLDLGCGMGMAGTVAAALGARVMFADLEAPALLFAQLNSLPWRHRVQTRKLDWTRDRLGRRFDRILGADILYERAQWSWLESFWRAHLKEGGQVILGEPGRQTGDLFVEWITSQGWQLTTTLVPVSTRPRPIRIFSIS